MYAAFRERIGAQELSSSELETCVIQFDGVKVDGIGILDAQGNRLHQRVIA